MNSLTLNTYYALASTTPATTERKITDAISKQESYARAPGGVRLDIPEIMRPLQVRAQNDDLRLARWKRRMESKKLLKGFRNGTRLYSVAKCDWTLGNLVTVTSNGEKASFVGVEHCHSISACPCCSAAIRHQRALEIQEVVQKHITAGGSAIFATLTMPHHAGDRLKPMLKAASKSWRRITSHKWWKTQGHAYIRTLEITYGKNGWHPHYHLLILTENTMSDTEISAFGARLQEEWAKGVESILGKRPLPQAQDIQRCDEKGQVLAQYLGKVQDGKKWSVAAEMARFDLKNGTESITPFQLLDTESGLETAERKRLWQEYVAATYGARVITWSRGLKARYEIEELTDEQAQEKTEEIAAQKAIYATPAKIYRNTPPQEKCRVLQAIERQDLTLAQKILPDYHTIPRQQWE